LKERGDIKEIIMRPIWSRFGLRKPKVEIDEAGEACQRAFSTVCAFIGTRDLVQEHVAYRIWPLIDSWEMPKETITNPSEGGLVRLKYTFRFGDQFIEPDDDWLKCVENTSDELHVAYSKSEDNALSAAFGSRKKKRLNRVFDAIGFVYPDYRYPPRGQKRKGATSGKAAASAASSEPAPKRKKLKVLTHRPCYIESATVPEFGGETSSAIEAKGPALTQRIEEPVAMPKTEGVELKAFTVSNTSSTFAILLLLGVAARPFCVFGTVTSAEELKISNIFVSLIFGSSALPLSAFDSASSAEGTFGIIVGSSAFYVGEVGSFGLAAEEVSLPNSGTTAGSI
jgi:hypothetical protein